MSDRKIQSRQAVARALRGKRNAIMADQMRALGRSARVIGRDLGVPPEVVARWFELQDGRARFVERAKVR